MARDEADRDICSECGCEDSCCVMSIAIVGHGIPLYSIGVGDDAKTLYTGDCVRRLIDRARAEMVPKS